MFHLFYSVEDHWEAWEVLVYRGVAELGLETQILYLVGVHFGLDTVILVEEPYGLSRLLSLADVWIVPTKLLDVGCLMHNEAVVYATLNRRKPRDGGYLDGKAALSVTNDGVYCIVRRTDIVARTLVSIKQKTFFFRGIIESCG
jgi:hypothetical protein